MNNLAGFLEKYKKLIFKGSAFKDAVVLAIKEISGIEISKDLIEHKGATLKLSLNPSQRAHLALYEKQILKRIGDLTQIYFKRIV